MERGRGEQDDDRLSGSDLRVKITDLPPHAADVAILLPDLRPGGAERVCVTLANAFAREGLTVDLVLRQKQGELQDSVSPAVMVHTLGARRVRDAFGPFVDYLKVARPRSVLAAMWPITSLAVAARAVASVPCRVVTSDHGVLSASGPGRPGLPRLAMTLSMRASYGRADAIVGVSRGVSADVATLAGLPLGRVTTIYNPITPLAPPAAPDAEIMAAWTSGGPQLVTVGTLKAVKDHATLLRALVRVRQAHDARLLILGEGSERPGLEALVVELGLAGAVQMPGFRPDPHGYVAHADAFVLSSLNEGFGNVLVEAMACGTPVVSTDCPTGPGEILEGGRYGALTTVGDANALAAAILGTLAAPPDPALLRQRSQDFSTARAVSEYRRLLGV